MLLGVLSTGTDVAGGQVPIKLEPLVHGLASPGYATSFPGNPNIIVVCERGTGKVRSFDLSGSPGGPILTPVVVLDLSSEAYLPAASISDHGGLSGLAYHPKFEQGRQYRFMYVRFVRQVSTNPPVVEVVVRRYAVAMGTTVANPASGVDEFVYAMTNAGAGNHTSGLLHFDPRPLPSGPDDFHLYIPMPDASFGSPTLCECQNPSSPQTQHNTERVQDDAYLEGKLARLALRFTSGGATPIPYPPTSPEVVAKGLRHPYGFSVDPGHSVTQVGRGNVWIGDTGSDRPGDLHVFPASGGGVCPGASCKNYGWPFWHGVPTTTSNGPAACLTQQLPVPPCTQAANAVFEAPYYAPGRPAGDNNGGGNGVLIGGVVYRGAALAGSPYNLGGRYFYALWGDFHSHVMSLDPSQSTAAAINASLLNHRTDLEMHVPGATFFGGQQLHGVSVDADGEMLVLRVDFGLPAATYGSVFRIVPE